MVRSFLAVTIALMLLITTSGCNNNPSVPSPAPGAEIAKPAVVPAELASIALDVKAAGLHKLQATAPTGKVVKYAIWVPKQLPKDKKVPLVMALHYAGKDTDHYGAGLIEALYQPACDELGAIIVAPDSLTGDDWDNPTNLDYVAWLTRSAIQSYPIDEKKVILSGFSAGGIGTWFIAARADGLFTAAVPVAGRPNLKGAEMTIPLCAVHSEADTICLPGPTKAAVAKLSGGPKKSNIILLTDGTTHYTAGAYVKPLRKAFAWVVGTWNS